MSSTFDASKLAPFGLLNEPQLTFDPSDRSLDVNPLRGLDAFGPYSVSTFRTYTPELRVASIAPSSGWAGLRNLIDTLRASHAPGDRKEYVPRFRGFAEVFGVPLTGAPTGGAHIKLHDDLSGLGQSGSPQERLMQAVRSGLDWLMLVRDQFDVVLVHLPDAWQIAFRAPGFLISANLQHAL
jgi:hypothetical protein